MTMMITGSWPRDQRSEIMSSVGDILNEIHFLSDGFRVVMMVLQSNVSVTQGADDDIYYIIIDYHLYQIFRF